MSEIAMPKGQEQSGSCTPSSGCGTKGGASGQPSQPGALQSAWIFLVGLAKDRVWQAVVLVLLALALLLPDQFMPSLGFTGTNLKNILPFLVFSAIAAAWLQAAGANRLIAKAVSGAPGKAILIAALVGALSPFCSCGVVPLIAALLAAGVPLSAVMAFWVSSPLMDPQQFLLMVPLLGLEFTLAKTATALMLGLSAGGITYALGRAGFLQDVLRPDFSVGCASNGLLTGEVKWSFWKEGERRAAFWKEARSVTFFLLKWLTLAFLLESLMVAYLPPDLVTQYLGQGAGAIPLAAVLGVPAYLNGFAAIPLMAQLLDTGMAPGAALAFLVGGGVTSIPAAMAVFALVKKQVFALYLAIALTGALAAGYLFQAWNMI
ncbi:permease [Rhodovibrionaceae bacterium A322]